MTPDITPAASADLRAIFDLLDANQLPRAGLEQHVGSTLVARENGRIVGSAALELYGVHHRVSHERGRDGAHALVLHPALLGKLA
jgi:N-acetylglutamate synthase-like GNAT family acetyltransferase